jgi:hypothetical protein
MPLDYDIHGPYGIKKGSSVKLKTFKNRLEKIGHEKYYALDGGTDGRLGFNILLDAKLKDTTYTELIIWYAKDAFDIKFTDIVNRVIVPLSLSTGYEIEINDGFNIQTENKIKKGFLGGISLKITYDHLQWLLGCESGVIRDIFKKNIWSESQLKNVMLSGRVIKYEQIGNLYYVENDA